MRNFVRCLLAAFVLCASLASAQTTILVGAGSTVPQPLYNAWGEKFNRQDASVQLRYLGLGTSEGIAQVTKGNADFGAGEVRMTAAEARRNGLELIPVAVVGIVPVYNVPGAKELKFSGDVLAGIFLGTIKNWNDPKIAKLNPGVKLPDLAIKTVHRPDGKGSNYIFTNFLSKSSAAFKSQIGVTASPKWPGGTKAERSSDVVDEVKSANGSIGYVEHSYAVKNGVEYAAVENAAGQFVKASKSSLVAAASTASPSDDASDITGASAKEAYPMASFTWVYVRTKNTDEKRARALASMLSWILGEGQSMTEVEGYVSLPPSVETHAKKMVDGIK